MPRRSFLRDLEEASVRGVSVNVLIPQQVDQLIADRINHRYLRLLEGSGIHFFLQPHMNHGKAMIVDRKMAIVGSPNFDFLSLEVNDEIGVAFSDPDVIQKLLTQTDRWRKESYPYNHNKARRHLIDWFLFPFLAFFQMF
jgi:cardiolipin synthase